MNYDESDTSKNPYKITIDNPQNQSIALEID